jgi:hypothetical protein
MSEIHENTELAELRKEVARLARLVQPLAPQPAHIQLRSVPDLESYRLRSRRDGENALTSDTRQRWCCARFVSMRHSAAQPCRTAVRHIS